MANIAQNITEISKIIGCSEDFYKTQDNTTDPYYESTMYLVNKGTIGITDLYYGARKLSDVIVVDDYPDSVDYPNDKLYLKPRYSIDDTSLIVGYDVFYKYNNKVLPIDTNNQLIRVDEVEGAVLKITTIIEGQSVSVNLLCLDKDEGSGSYKIPDDIYNTLKNQLTQEISQSVHSLVWESISDEPTPPTTYVTDTQVANLISSAISGAQAVINGRSDPVIVVQGVDITRGNIVTMINTYISNIDNSTFATDGSPLDKFTDTVDIQRAIDVAVNQVLSI